MSQAVMMSTPAPKHAPALEVETQGVNGRKGIVGVWGCSLIDLLESIMTPWDSKQDKCNTNIFFVTLQGCSWGELC